MAHYLPRVTARAAKLWVNGCFGLIYIEGLSWGRQAGEGTAQAPRAGRGGSRLLLSIRGRLVIKLSSFLPCKAVTTKAVEWDWGLHTSSSIQADLWMSGESKGWVTAFVLRSQKAAQPWRYWVAKTGTHWVWNALHTKFTLTQAYRHPHRDTHRHVYAAIMATNLGTGKEKMF